AATATRGRRWFRDGVAIPPDARPPMATVLSRPRRQSSRPPAWPTIRDRNPTVRHQRVRCDLQAGCPVRPTALVLRQTRLTPQVMAAPAHGHCDRHPAPPTPPPGPAPVAS